MSQMLNFDKARIATEVAYQTPGMSNMKVLPITLVNRVNIKTTFPAEPYHSITEYNMGYIEKPPEFRFSIGVPSMSPEVTLFRALQTGRIPFNMSCYDATDFSETSQFKLLRETLVECRIESRELTINVGEAPMSLFAGIALRYMYNYIGADGHPVETPVDSLIYTNFFGSGNESTTLSALFAEWA